MKGRLTLLFAMFLAACTASGGGPAAEQATAEAVGQKATAAALSARSTSVAGTQAVADAAQATSAVQTQQAESRAATRQASTESAITMATQAAVPMAEVVEQLHREGLLSSSDGAYTLMDPFDQSWAQLNWYQYYFTGESPTDFVLRASASWDSASDHADWWNSGCGIVFRETNVDNHYIVFLGLDGYAYMARFRNGVPAELGHSFYGPLDVPSGNAAFMLVVEGNQFTFYVNDTRVLQRQDSAHSEGNLAYTLVSGTNKDYGTHCTLNNVELWSLD